MSVLALDPGVRTGWAWSDGRCGVLDLSGYDDHGRAAAVFHDWLDGELMRERPLYLAVEQHFAHGRRRDANTSLTEWLCGIAHMIAWSHDVPRCEKPASSVRKWLTGDGKAKDKQVMDALVPYGFRTTSPHAADAAALLCFCEKRDIRSAA